MRNLAVVLVSGGMDSAVTLAIAAQKHNIAMLHIDYGQRTEKKERECFRKLAEHYTAKHKLIVPMEHLKLIGGSSLTDPNIEVPTGLCEQGIPNTYVPFRNAMLLSIGTAWAEVLKAQYIYIGATEEDAAGYPDCREEFYRAFNKVIETGTKPETQITICTPVIHMDKTQIVKLGYKLSVPFHLTWSCYIREDIACGECDSCLRRLRAFKSANIKDPIPYIKEGCV